MNTSKKRILLPCAAILILTASCEDLLTDPGAGGDIVSSLEDTWKVEENSNEFGKHNYLVEIMRHESDSARIYVDNFYDVDASLEVVVTGRSLNIPEQRINGGFSVEGTGTVSSNLQTISWQYSVDDGSGQPDQCTAVYTRF